MQISDDGTGARIFPADLARFLVGYYNGKGVDVRPGERVSGVTERDSQVVVETNSGLRVGVDVVIAGIGILPNTDLAAAAGLLVEDGIVVDESFGRPIHGSMRPVTLHASCLLPSVHESASSTRTMR